jgi:hypothetical protein
LESDIACSKCCGGSGGAYITRKEKELARMMEMRDVLHERKNAGKPSGKLKTCSNDYYGASGDWYYPIILYDSCGGACGGGVACDGGKDSMFDSLKCMER